MPPPAITIDGEDEFEVERLLDKRTKRNRVEYLVKWARCPEYEATWEPVANLSKNASEAIVEFELGNITHGDNDSIEGKRSVCGIAGMEERSEEASRAANAGMV